MLLYVYFTRYRGQPVAPEAIIQNCLRGDVRVERYESGWTNRRRLLARVTQADNAIRDLVPAMRVMHWRVRVALVIGGIEEVPRGKRALEEFRQVWVCSPAPIPLELWPRKADRHSGLSETGFHPRDD